MEIMETMSVTPFKPLLIQPQTLLIHLQTLLSSYDWVGLYDSNWTEAEKTYITYQVLVVPRLY